MIRVLIFLALFLASPSYAADSTVTALPAAAALGGTELYYCVQGGGDNKCTTSQIKTFTSSSPTLVTPVLGVASGTSLTLGTVSSVTGQLSLANSGSVNLTTIQAGNAAAARTYTWPTNFGAAGTVLTDAAGNGTLSWAAGGGGLTVGTSTITSGTTQQILYDNAGVLGEITKCNSGVYQTNGSGVPSCGTSLPFNPAIVSGTASITSGVDTAVCFDDGGIMNCGGTLRWTKGTETFGVGTTAGTLNFPGTTATFSVGGATKLDYGVTQTGWTVSGAAGTGNFVINTANSELDAPIIGIKRNTTGGVVRAYIAADANNDGNMLFTNNGFAGFGLLKFGDVTSSFPALKVVGNAFTVRKGDDSADAGLTTATLTVSALPNVATTSAVCYNTGTGVLSYDATVGTCTVSAVRFKDGVASIKSSQALDMVMAMQPKSWHYKWAPGHERIGLVADDLALIDRRLIGLDANGQIQNDDYFAVVTLLVGAIKEQQQEIDSLKRKAK